MSKLSIQQYLLYAMILGLLISTLCYSDFFIYKSLTPCFCYLIGISVFFIYGAAVITVKSNHIFSLSRPVLITMLLGLYIIIQGLFLSRSMSSYSYYLIINCGFLISFYIVLRVVKPNLQLIYKLILIVAIAEASVCILQFFKLLNSLNNYFAVTGTWENPNVIAMFIAMSIPSAYVLIYDEKKYIRKAIPFILLFLISTLLILKCRTAIAGAVLSGFIILTNKYQLVTKINDKRNRSAIALIIIMSLGVMVPIINYAYHAKKESADGRMLVWKISLKMITDKPLFGYGYGAFEKNYNLFQSQYFESGKGTTGEMKNAGYIRMGYNEFIQNAVEGGLIGCILFGCLLISLLLTPLKHFTQKQTSKNCPDSSYVIAAYAGVCAFMIMCLINYTVQAIPVFCLFIIYASILSAKSPTLSFGSGQTNQIRIDNSIPVNKKPAIFNALCLFILGIGSCYVTSMLIIDNRCNKEAALLVKQGNYQSALNILPSLSPRLDAYESFWVNYGNALFESKAYNNALLKFERAILVTSNPTVYYKLALCYEKTGDYDKAYQNLVIAGNIEPNRIAPQFALMNLYLKMKDTTNALLRAQYIVTMDTKIRSDRALQYKNQAYTFMKKIGVTYHNNLNKMYP